MLKQLILTDNMVDRLGGLLTSINLSLATFSSRRLAVSQPDRTVPELSELIGSESESLAMKRVNTTLVFRVLVWFGLIW
jgi:hypothetical protein